MNNSTKILLNTGILYGKMLITVILSLISTRWVLNALGTSDFGIYNLVAGLIAMFSFLNTAMTVASQRYLSYAIGTKDNFQLKKTFYYSVVLHFAVGLLVLFVFELFGPYFLKSILTIPIGKDNDAMFVFHCLSITTFLTIITVPYQALSNAHENMLLIAVISIVESLLKFFSAYLILSFAGNRLRLYALFLVVIGIVSIIIIRTYCRRNYLESKIFIDKINDIAFFKEFSMYAIWNFIGALGGMIKTQGIAVILNIFYGVVVNAAYGIANQINGQLSFLANTLVKAIQPQLMQSEGAGNRERMLKLSVLACKMPSFLLIVLLMPLFVSMNYILQLWLKTVPEHTVIFCQLVLAYTFVYQSFHGIELSIHASGKIKEYQLFGYGMQIMVLPLSFYFLKAGFRPECVLIVSLVFCLFNLFVTVHYAHRYAELCVKSYVRDCLFPIYSLLAISFISCHLLNKVIPYGILGILLLYVINSLLVILIFWFVFSNEEEKRNVTSMLSRLLKITIKDNG